MTPRDRDFDLELDRVLADIRDEEPAPEALAAARTRIAARLAAEAESGDVAQKSGHAALRGCEDVQALIPALIAGHLPAERALLVEDHTRSCVGCRRALREARGQAGPDASGFRARPESVEGSRRARRMAPLLAVAALVVMAVLVGAVALMDSGGPSEGVFGEVADIEGVLFRIAEGRSVAVEAGDRIGPGELIRTSREGGATLRLDDGSRVELAERTSLALRRRGDQTTIDLARGNIIVDASPQGSGHLNVAANDCRVAVTGTVFAVNSGLKGSRVSVLEGSVAVSAASGRELLSPGEQMTTSDKLGRVPLEEEIAWSRHLDERLALLREFEALRRELDERVEPPAARYDSALLRQLPLSTTVVVSMPNLGPQLIEAQAIVRERMASSPALSAWWEETISGPGNEALLDAVVAKLERVSGAIGDELVLALAWRGPRQMAPLLVAPLTRPDEARALLEEARVAFAEQKDAPALRVVEGPLPEGYGQSAGTELGEALHVWISDAQLVASLDPALIRGVADARGGGAFASTPFARALEHTLAAGAEWLVGIDIERTFARLRQDDEESAQRLFERLDQLGLTSARHLLARATSEEDATLQELEVTFREERRGVAAWLAAPAPLGSLEFVSPDATLAAAAAMQSPEVAIDRLLDVLGDRRVEVEARFAEHTGVRLREDLARSIGGEIAFALDGPLLPKPSWKVVVEVNDPALFLSNVRSLLETVSANLEAEGYGRFTASERRFAGQPGYLLRDETLGQEVALALVDGYALLGGSAQLVERTLQQREAGISLLSGPSLLELLPSDERANVSMLVYDNFGPGLGRSLEALSGTMRLTPEQRALVSELAASGEPGLTWAYGGAQSIELARRRAGGLFAGEFGGFDVGALLGLQQLFATSPTFGGLESPDEAEVSGETSHRLFRTDPESGKSFVSIDGGAERELSAEELSAMRENERHPDDLALANEGTR